MEANIVDPDDPSGTDSSIPPTTATFRLAREDEPDEVVWEGHASNAPFGGSHYLLHIPGGTMTQGRYVWSVFGTDGYGQVGPSASCAFELDFTNPKPPVITPLVGGQAVYVKGIGSGRGGVGIPGSFLISDVSNDTTRYRYGINSGVATKEISASGNTVLNFTPTRTGRNDLSVEGFDAAGNRSPMTTFEFYVGSGVSPTPPAITVTGPTTYTLGDVPTASVELSADAATPYGTVTVTSGSAEVGSAKFDERTEKLVLDAAALGTGTKTLTFTYRAYPEAPAWSTSRKLTINLPVFSAPRSPALSGTAQVGKTLTAVRGTWTPSPTKTTYQWRVDGKAVSGATGSTWKVPASARGKKVSVAVTGTKTGYATKTLVSPSSSAVKAGVFSAPAPRITGTPKVGATLRVVRGTWTPQPTTAKYQWKVGSTSIKGATRSFFTVPSSARGKRVTVVVTGSAAGYTTKVVSRTTTNTMK
jgi:hypothetical protein